MRPLSVRDFLFPRHSQPRNPLQPYRRPPTRSTHNRWTAPMAMLFPKVPAKPGMVGAQPTQNATRAFQDTPAV
jgi:hypothetical protein